MDTYKDTSSIIVFYDYVANDLSVPYLQFVVLALILPATYGIYRLLRKLYRPRVSDARDLIGNRFYIKKSVFAMVIFYIASYSFVYFIWTGNARMTKLRPVVPLIYNDLFVAKKVTGHTEADLGTYRMVYQGLWQKIEGDSSWAFEDSDAGNHLPLYRMPSEKLKIQREMQPNFILVLMESQRGLNTGYMNPQIKPSPTPFMDSLTRYSHVWTRMHTSGIPTTGGVLSTHLGIPHLSRLAQATDLTHMTLPASFRPSPKTATAPTTCRRRTPPGTTWASGCPSGTRSSTTAASGKTIPPSWTTTSNTFATRWQNRESPS